MKRIIFYILAIILLASCGDYQKILKSTDPELKYNAAVDFFNQKEFAKAQSLFDNVTSYYRGTERSEDILNYLCRCYVGQKLYASAIEYYQTYIRNYPKGRHIIEARYMIGYCYYIESPDARLDQTATNEAIRYLSDFLDLYPQSDYAADARKYLDEMTDKLVQKELYNAQLYYNLGTYLGNNYQSAIVVANSALKKYPNTRYREELCYIILQSKYKEAELSVAEKRQERLQDAADEYYSFITEFPDSKYRKNAERIHTQLDKIMK